MSEKPKNVSPDVWKIIEQIAEQFEKRLELLAKDKEKATAVKEP